MRFSDIPGQEEAKQALRSFVDSGHLPHAVMISGPAGAGKMLLARAFAQYVQCNCRSGGEPCGNCPDCRLNSDLNHPDVRFIFPYVRNKKLGRESVADCAPLWQQMLAQNPAMPIEKWQEMLDAGNSQLTIYSADAEDIIRSDSLSSFTSRHKVFIIWLPELMQEAAANKLLKVIEEPAEGSLFILISNNDLGVLPTIFSRVQHVRASRQSDAQLTDYLISNFNFSPDTAKKYARLCDGSLIKADEFGENSGENEEFFSIYKDVMRAAYAKRVMALRALSESVAAFGREKCKRFLEYMSRMTRENFIFNLRLPPLTALTPEEEEFARRFAPFVNHANVEEFLSETDRARRDIERNANGKVVIFDYFILLIILLHRKPD